MINNKSLIPEEATLVDFRCVEEGEYYIDSEGTIVKKQEYGTSSPHPIIVYNNIYKKPLHELIIPKGYYTKYELTYPTRKDYWLSVCGDVFHNYPYLGEVLILYKNNKITFILEEKDVSDQYKEQFHAYLEDSIDGNCGSYTWIKWLYKSDMNISSIVNMIVSS